MTTHASCAGIRERLDAGAELGGIPLVTAASLASGLPCVFIRNQKKDYGTAEQLEGTLDASDRVVIVGHGATIMLRHIRHALRVRVVDWEQGVPRLRWEREAVYRSVQEGLAHLATHPAAFPAFPAFPGEVVTLQGPERDHVVLLRRDDTSPYLRELDTREAIDILRVGEFMVAPGATIFPEEIGTLKQEPWYNPYLLAPDDAFEAERFAAVKDQGGARYLIINTSSMYANRGPDGQPDINELIDRTGKKILEHVSRYAG